MYKNVNEKMNTLLLILKILGIAISSASIIGSERLRKFEFKLRNSISPQNIDLRFNELTAAMSYSVLKLSVPKESENSPNNYQSPNYSSRFLSKFYKLIAIINGVRQPQNRILKTLLTIFLIFSKSVLYTAFIVVSLPFSIILLISNVLIVVTPIFIRLSFVFILLIITITLAKSLRFCVWFVSRPYIWIDREIQKRQLESTIVVIGLLIAIVAEILSSYYN